MLVFWGRATCWLVRVIWLVRVVWLVRSVPQWRSLLELGVGPSRVKARDKLGWHWSGEGSQGDRI